MCLQKNTVEIARSRCNHNDYAVFMLSNSGSKIHQIDGVITSSAAEGMMTMDGSLLKLYKDGIITDNTAVSFSTQAELMKKRIAGGM